MQVRRHDSEPGIQRALRATVTQAGASSTHRLGVPVGVAWGVLSALAYSLSAVVGKDLLDDLRAHEMLFWRFSIAAPVAWVLLLIRRSRGGPDPLAVRGAPLVGLGVLFSYMAWIGFVALEDLDTSLYIVLVYIYPAIVAAVAPLLGQAVRPQVWVAIAVISLGVTLTVPGLWRGEVEAKTIGIVLTLVQAVVLAGFTVVSSRTISRHADGLSTLGWSAIGSWLAMGALCFANGLDLPGSPSVVWKLVFFATVPTIVATGAFYQALQTLEPTAVATIATLEPALTVIWAVLLLGDSLAIVQITGTVLVLVGVVWSQRASAR